MSNRTLVELNHDYAPREQDRQEWAEKLCRYLASGDRAHLPRGVTFKHFRHHSEPDPIDVLATLTAQRDQLVKALKSARGLAGIAESLISCQADEEYVSGVIAEIDAALYQIKEGA